MMKNKMSGLVMRIPLAWLFCSTGEFTDSPDLSTILYSSREVLVDSRGCTWLCLLWSLAGYGHSRGQSGNNVRKQKQPSPEGVGQQGLRVLRVVVVTLRKQLLQMQVLRVSPA